METKRVAIVSLAVMTCIISAVHTVYAQSNERFRFGESEGRGNPYGGIGGLILYGVIASMIGVTGYAIVHASTNLLKGYKTDPKKDGVFKGALKRDRE